MCALGLGLLLLLQPPPAQDGEAALRRYFEGRQVTIKLDMPATKYGIDVYYRAAEPVDFHAYARRLKSYGIAIHSGDRVTVTTVKVKADVIEFQLGGGGWGTFGDSLEAGGERERRDARHREETREKALAAGSRFNIRFAKGRLAEKPPAPDVVMEALSRYVDFGDAR